MGSSSAGGLRTSRGAAGAEGGGPRVPRLPAGCLQNDQPEGLLVGRRRSKNRGLQDLLELFLLNGCRFIRPHAVTLLYQFQKLHVLLLAVDFFYQISADRL